MLKMRFNFETAPSIEFLSASVCGFDFQLDELLVPGMASRNQMIPRL
jgi:hypothetical protein